MRTYRSVGLAALLALLLCGPDVQAVQLHFIDFEGWADFTSLVNQYAAQNATFSNASVLKSGSAGGSLNEVDFPPHSGDNVVLDDGGAMRIDFGLTTYDWSAYFTYNEPLTVRAWDASNNLLGIVNSSFSANFTTSGNSPNELLAFSAVSGFRSITIEGDAAGQSFVMDDMSYTTEDAPQGVPEPGTVLLLATGLVSSGLAARKRVFRGR